MNNYYSNNTYTEVVDTSRVSAIMKRVYVHMTFGLLLTALVALALDSSPGAKLFFVQNSWLMWGSALVELGIVIGIGAGINRLSGAAALALFYVFAAVNGLTFWPIFEVYTSTSIAKTFFITAGTFGAMSIYGYCTDRDLTRFGSILFMALIGLVIASLVNLFLHSTGLMWVLTIGGVIIFVGLTAWDTQQIKRMAMMMPDAGVSRLACIGALNLYLDFINLFLYLLRIFGDNRN